MRNQITSNHHPQKTNQIKSCQIRCFGGAKSNQIKSNQIMIWFFKIKSNHDLIFKNLKRQKTIFVDKFFTKKVLKTRCFCKSMRFCTFWKIFFFKIASTTIRKMGNFFCRYLIKIAEKSNHGKNQIKSNQVKSGRFGVSNQIKSWFDFCLSLVRVR